MTAAKQARSMPKLRLAQKLKSKQQALPAFEPKTESAREPRTWKNRISWFESTSMMLACTLCAGSFVWGYKTSLRQENVIAGLQLEGQSIDGLSSEELKKKVEELSLNYQNQTLILKIDGVEKELPTSALGAVPDIEATIHKLQTVGRSGHLLADLQTRAQAARGQLNYSLIKDFSEEAALHTLQDLSLDFERPSLPTILDLKQRKVVSSRQGSALLPEDAVSAIAVALASGAKRIELTLSSLPEVQDDPLKKLGPSLDIDTVLGQFSTPYPTTADAADRNHNLMLGAMALDGYILGPGETMSFNEVVGERSLGADFRYAPGIEGGVIVNVIGGGICQISSTLFGAAFFAGLDIVAAKPHSRPSSYVDMGLDSTVVFDQVDMKLANPFPFPVVFHMQMADGQVHAEVLGPERPYKIAFERKIVAAIPFTSTVRESSELKIGSEELVQQGKRGFQVEVKRIFYRQDEVFKVERRELHYPPTLEIIAKGTNPSGRVAKEHSPVRLQDPKENLRIVQ